MMQVPDPRDQGDPQQHHLVRRAGGIDDVFLEGLHAELLLQGLKPHLPQLLGAQGNVRSERKQLSSHVNHPHAPQQMQQAEALKYR